MRINHAFLQMRLFRATLILLGLMSGSTLFIVLENPCISCLIILESRRTFPSVCIFLALKLRLRFGIERMVLRFNAFGCGALSSAKSTLWRYLGMDVTYS